MSIGVSCPSYAAALLSCHTCATASSTAAGRSTTRSRAPRLPRGPHPGRRVPRRRAGPRRRRPGAGGRHPLPGRPSSRPRPARAGIGDDTFVVAYGSLGGAERLWWLLRHFGHDDCAVLDLDAWHGPLRAGEETRRAGRSSRRRAHRTTRSTATSSPRRLGELVVVDARLPRRWRGEPNPVDRVPGRIPGALNAPWNEPSRAAARTASSSPTAARASRPASTLHRLHLAGRDGRLYPGSWSEWEQHPELPVERSAPRLPRSRSRTGRGTAPSAAGSSASRGG